MTTEPLPTLPLPPAPMLARLTTRRLSRAHRALAERPSLVRELSGAVAPAAEALSRALGAPLSLSARLLESLWSPQRALARDCAFLLLDLTCQGATAVVELDRPLAARLVGRLSGEACTPGPVLELTRIESAALGYLALVAISAASSAPAVGSAFAPRLRSVAPSAAEAALHLDDAPHLMVELTLSADDLAGTARLLLPAASLKTVAHARPREGTGGPAREILDARVPLRCFLSGGQLTSRELDGLTPKDVLLLDGVRLEEGQVRGKVRFELLGQSLQGALDPHGLTGAARAPSQLPEDDMNPSNEGAPPFAVDVEVELARVQLPLSEIATLKAGFVLPLRVSAGDPVTLRVGDRAVARAELVDVEGEVGARITGLVA